MYGGGGSVTPQHRSESDPEVEKQNKAVWDRNGNFCYLNQPSTNLYADMREAGGSLAGKGPSDELGLDDLRATSRTQTLLFSQTMGS